MSSNVATSVGGNPHRIYFNARLSATPAADTSAPPLPVVFREQRPSPLINKANDYKLSIIRFLTTLQSLPALIVEHPAGSTGLTAYTFTIVVSGTPYSGTVQWTPANAALTPGSGDMFDEFWWEYDYVRFTSLVNATLASIATLAGTVAPFFQYDTASATFKLFLPVAFAPGGTAQLFADTQAHHLFSGFPVARSSSPNREFQYLAILQPGEAAVTVSGNSYIVRQQTPGSLTNWNPVRRFVFTSASLPVVPEAVVQPTPLSGAPQASSLATQAIIADMTPELSRGDELRSGTLEYNPSAQYRFCDLRSSNPINDIDFSLYWQDQLGNLHLHYLLHNGYTAVKFLFEKV